MYFPYRKQYKEKDKEMKYLYTMFNVLRDVFSKSLKWLTWENFIYLGIATVTTIIVIFSIVVLFGALFFKNTVGECYISSSDNNSYVKQDINWKQDGTVIVCIKGDVDCLDKGLSSKACEK